MISLTRKILDKGHIISMKNGLLCVHSASGDPASDKWMQAHSSQIKREILCALGVDEYKYIGYSTGHYGPPKAAGVTLQFVSLTTGKEVYVVFNVELTRARTTRFGKKGEPLPMGQFRVGSRYEFYKFWLRTGLKSPSRLSKFHDHMGNLRDIIFIAPLEKNRLLKQQLRPLTLSHEEIFAAFMPPNISTTSAQPTNNVHTAMPHNILPREYEIQGMQPTDSTGATMYVNKVKSMSGYKAPSIPPCKPPAEQSVEEWLESYGDPDAVESV